MRRNRTSRVARGRVPGYPRFVMRYRAVIVLLLALLPLAGCPDQPVCKPDPAGNTCGVDSDCVLAYCATDCCWCQQPFARAQVEATWCLATDGTLPEYGECLRGRDARCAGGPPCVCPHNIEPWCNAGKCDVRAITP